MSLYLIFILALGGLGITVICYAIRRGRLVKPCFWTGLAGGIVIGLSMSLLADTGQVGDTALMLGYIFGVLGMTIGYLTDILIEDGKARA